MKALTLHRPWSDAIAYLPEEVAKRVENRTWRPPSWALGKRIAIHGGKAFDEAAVEDIRALLEDAGVDAPVPDEPESAPGIVATARIVGVVEPDAGGRARITRSLEFSVPPAPPAFDARAARWWTGEIGWLLDDVVALPVIPSRGHQGLWSVPGDLLERIRDLEAVVRSGALDPRPCYVRAHAKLREIEQLDDVEVQRRRVRAGVRSASLSRRALATLEAQREIGLELASFRAGRAG